MPPDSLRADSEVASPAAEPRAQARRQTAARDAERGSRLVEIEWIVVATVIALVVLVGFGLELLLG